MLALPSDEFSVSFVLGVCLDIRHCAHTEQLVISSSNAFLLKANVCLCSFLHALCPVIRCNYCTLSFNVVFKLVIASQTQNKVCFGQIRICDYDLCLKCYGDPEGWAALNIFLLQDASLVGCLVQRLLLFVCLFCLGMFLPFFF